jgi:hypothetical protein
MDPIIQLRFRQSVAILVAAVVTAAEARHHAPQPAITSEVNH